MKNIESPTSTVVDFESVWDDGTISTKAVLNLQTGEVINIETSDEGDNFECLQYEQISDVSRGVTAMVVENGSGQYFLKDMAMLTQFGGAEIHDSCIACASCNCLSACRQCR